MAGEFWKTELSKVEKSKILIRGYRVQDLMERCSFGEVVYLLFTGELPKGNEGKMIEVILISSVDHSLLAPSIDAVRFVASCGVPLQASVASGVIALGDIHGGAIEECAKMFHACLDGVEEPDLKALAEKLVLDYKNRKERVLGYGHPIHNPDPRTVKMLQIADELKITGKFIRFSLAVEKALKTITGRDLPMNVDGAIAAVICDMGIDWRIGKGFFILSRAVGLIAHAYEQMTKEKPFRELPVEEIVYKGPKERDLPGREKLY